MKFLHRCGFVAFAFRCISIAFTCTMQRKWTTLTMFASMFEHLKKDCNFWTNFVSQRKRNHDKRICLTIGFAWRIAFRWFRKSGIATSNTMQSYYIFENLICTAMFQWIHFVEENLLVVELLKCITNSKAQRITFSIG